MTTPVKNSIPGYLAGNWDIDPVHSDVSFAVRHMMVSRVRGRFATFSGEIVTGDDVADSSVTASIDPRSVDTGNKQRDADLRSTRFFDVQRYPLWTFRSTGIRADGGGYEVDGELTIKGVTRSVPLALEVNGIGPDAGGGTRAGFSASTTIDRNDFGIDIKLPFDGGGAVVGDTVWITLRSRRFCVGSDPAPRRLVSSHRTPAGVDGEASVPSRHDGRHPHAGDRQRRPVISTGLHQRRAGQFLVRSPPQRDDVAPRWSHTGSRRWRPGESVAAIRNRLPNSEGIDVDMDWRSRAACRIEEPELFFPVGTSGPALVQTALAIAVCRRCPVMIRCRTWALTTGQAAGVWGGMSEHQRRAARWRGRLDLPLPRSLRVAPEDEDSAGHAFTRSD